MLNCLISATLKGGFGGGIAGTAVGALGVYAATTRYPAFRQLTLPFRAFLIVSTGTFSCKPIEAQETPAYQFDLIPQKQSLLPTITLASSKPVAIPKNDTSTNQNQ